MRSIVTLTLTCVMVGILGWTMASMADDKAPTPPPAPAPTPAPEVKAETKMLYDFEDDKDIAAAEAKSCETSQSPDHATSGKSSLKVVLAAAKLPGISFSKLTIKDWSGYKTLKFDIFTDDAMKFAMTIKDVKSKDYASRYNNEKIALVKGANAISIDLSDVGGAVDLKSLKQMSMFACGTLDKEATIYIDNIRLEK